MARILCRLLAVFVCLGVFFDVGYGEATSYECDVNAEIKMMMSEMAKTNRKFTRLQQENARLNEKLNSLAGMFTRSMDHSPSSFPVRRADELSSLAPVVESLSSQVDQLSSQVQTLQNSLEQQQLLAADSHVSVFVRWGHNACPSSGEVVYSGYVGGSMSRTEGAAANYLCLPREPVFDQTEPLDNLAELHGGEYHTFGESTYLLDALCAVCQAPRAINVMIPAALECGEGWTKEYSGHLMAGRPDHVAASEFICVDSALMSRPGSAAYTDGKLLYYTKTVCGTLPCPPYVNNKIVPCVVCSK